MISIYGTIIGLIINMILFYGFSFSPPMSLIPLFLSIVSLLIYSIWQKQFFDFVDLEAKEELQELQEIVKNQEMQDIPGQIDFLKGNDISFNDNNKCDNNNLFEDEKNLDDLKEYLTEDDSDEEEKKKHENMINEFNERINSNNNVRNNNRRMTMGNLRDSESEKVGNLFDLEDGGENKNNNFHNRAISKTLTVDPQNRLNFLFNSNKNRDKDKDIKIVEMKEFDEKSD
jgi:hypothetical protein